MGFKGLRILAEFQGGDPKQSEHDSHDPEPYGHRVFLPPREFEMVVQRGHLENPFARELETRNLQDHREGFSHEYTAHDRQEQFLFAADGEDAEEAPDRQ